MKRYPLRDTKMLVINRKTAKKIPIKDILYLRANSNYTYFVMLSGKTFLVSHSIKYYEDFLTNIHFVRVHRRYILNTLYVPLVEMEEISLINGESIAVSRRYWKVIKNTFEHKKRVMASS